MTVAKERPFIAILAKLQEIYNMANFAMSIFGYATVTPSGTLSGNANREVLDLSRGD